ncbi:uncharacterized protein O3C94_020183 [Discoglossus pictus]
MVVDIDKKTPPGLSESDLKEETNMRSPLEIKEEEIPVNISEGPLDVKPPVVSKVEQEDLNIRDQQQVKEEESPGSIREGSEEETDVRSHPEVKEEEIPVNIGEGPQDGDLYPDLYNEDGEYERDETSIHQMETHSNPCTDLYIQLDKSFPITTTFHFPSFLGCFQSPIR